jgi:DNA-binding IclR family transcriptional regulator
MSTTTPQPLPPGRGGHPAAGRHPGRHPDPLITASNGMTGPDPPVDRPVGPQIRGAQRALVASTGAPTTGRRDVNVTSVLGKAIAILRAFTPTDQSVRLAELARRTGLPKSTPYRMATAMVECGLLERPAHGYRLGTHLFELGMLASTQRGLREYALPFMEDLYEGTHETVHLAVVDGMEILTLEKISGHRRDSSPTRAGARAPMHTSAIGKVLLAHSPIELFHEVTAAGLQRVTLRTIATPGALYRDLARIIETGLGYDHEEQAIGVAGVAAPVFDLAGDVVAAIGVTGTMPRFQPFVSANAVRVAARRLSHILEAAPSGALDQLYKAGS